MHKNKRKTHKLKTITTAIIITALLTNCTTTKHRDLHLIQTLKLQNETLESLELRRTKKDFVKSESTSATAKKEEKLLLKTLNAVKKSNEAVISKLKPVNNKEFQCGKNERTHD